MSLVRSEDTVEVFRSSVGVTRNHVAYNCAKHYVEMLCVQNSVLFDTALVR